MPRAHLQKQAASFYSLPYFKLKGENDNTVHFFYEILELTRFEFSLFLSQTALNTQLLSQMKVLSPLFKLPLHCQDREEKPSYLWLQLCSPV